MKEKEISRDWVKMIALDNAEGVAYCASSFTGLKLTPRQLAEELQSGPVVEDGYIYEPIPEAQIPWFVEGPEDRYILGTFLEETGMTGTGRTYERTVFKEPYANLGFERVMAFGPGHYVYRKNGRSYLSLGRTFYTAGIKVNPAFIGLLMEIDNDPERDMIWFITPTQRGINRSFDILYDASCRDYLLDLGRQYQKEFIDSETIERTMNELAPPIFWEPARQKSSDPFSVLHEHYFGDCRYDAAISSGEDDYRQFVAMHMDSVDFEFRCWLVDPKADFGQVCFHVSELIECAKDDAANALREVLDGLKKQIIENEFYEYMSRFRNGVVLIEKHSGFVFEF